MMPNSLDCGAISGAMLELDRARMRHVVEAARAAAANAAGTDGSGDLDAASPDAARAKSAPSGALRKGISGMPSAPLHHFHVSLLACTLVAEMYWRWCACCCWFQQIAAQTPELVPPRRTSTRSLPRYMLISSPPSPSAVLVLVSRALRAHAIGED